MDVRKKRIRDGLNLMKHLIRVQLTVKPAVWATPLSVYLLFSFFIILTFERTVLLNTFLQITIMIVIMQSGENSDVKVLYRSLPVREFIWVLSKYLFAMAIALLIIMVFYAALFIVSLADPQNIFFTKNMMDFDTAWYRMFLPLIMAIIVYVPVKRCLTYLQTYLIFMFILLIPVIGYFWFREKMDALIADYLAFIHKIGTADLYFLTVALMTVSMLISVLTSIKIHKRS